MGVKRPPALQAERGGLAWRTLTSDRLHPVSAVEPEARNNQWCPDPKGANAAGPFAGPVCTLPPASAHILELRQVQSSAAPGVEPGPQTHYNKARP